MTIVSRVDEDQTIQLGFCPAFRNLILSAARIWSPVPIHFKRTGNRLLSPLPILAGCRRENHRDN